MEHLCACSVSSDAWFLLLICGYPCDTLVYWSPFSSMMLAENLNNLPEGQRTHEPENEELARN